jgi:hypothetical protein
MDGSLYSYAFVTKLITTFFEPRVIKKQSMKCPKCKMEIPSDAEICPYCHSRLRNSWGFTTNSTFDAIKSGYQRGSSNNGCMVILPLILAIAASACYVINTFI